MAPLAPAALIHKYLARLPNGDVALHDSFTGVNHLFTPTQLLLFVVFDQALRAGTFDLESDPVPGGYELFRDLWYSDAKCTYQFCFFNAENGNPVVVGQPIPVDLLVPDGTDTERVKSRYTPRQEEIIQGSLFASAAREQRDEEFRAKKKAERLAERRKRALSRMKAPAGGAGGRTGGCTGGRPGGRARGFAGSQAAAGPSASSSSVADEEVGKEAPATEAGANAIGSIKLRFKKRDAPVADAEPEAEAPATAGSSKGKGKAVEADVEMGREEELVDF